MSESKQPIELSSQEKAIHLGLTQAQVEAADFTEVLYQAIEDVCQNTATVDAVYKEHIAHQAKGHPEQKLCDIVYKDLLGLQDHQIKGIVLLGLSRAQVEAAGFRAFVYRVMERACLGTQSVNTVYEGKVNVGERYDKQKRSDLVYNDLIGLQDHQIRGVVFLGLSREQVEKPFFTPDTYRAIQGQRKKCQELGRAQEVVESIYAMLSKGDGTQLSVWCSVMMYGKAPDFAKWVYEQLVARNVNIGSALLAGKFPEEEQFWLQNKAHSEYPPAQGLEQAHQQKAVAFLGLTREQVEDEAFAKTDAIYHALTELCKARSWDKAYIAELYEKLKQIEVHQIYGYAHGLSDEQVQDERFTEYVCKGLSRYKESLCFRDGQTLRPSIDEAYKELLPLSVPHIWGKIVIDWQISAPEAEEVFHKLQSATQKTLNSFSYYGTELTPEELTSWVFDHRWGDISAAWWQEFAVSAVLRTRLGEGYEDDDRIPVGNDDFLAAQYQELAKSKPSFCERVTNNRKSVGYAASKMGCAIL